MRALDAVGGAALSAVAVLLVAWALGVAISGSRIGSVTPLVRSSAVLEKVNAVLPASAASVLETFNDVVGTSFFPRYLEPFAQERIVEVGPGPERLLTDPDVVDARPRTCSRSGAPTTAAEASRAPASSTPPDRLMTNAHVVAGVDDPEVEIDGTTESAEVVYYNPDLDVAVLALDGSGIDAARRSTTTAEAPRTASRSSATPRTGPTTSSSAGSAPSSGCGHPTSTARAR